MRDFIAHSTILLGNGGAAAACGRAAVGCGRVTAGRLLGTAGLFGVAAGLGHSEPRCHLEYA